MTIKHIDRATLRLITDQFLADIKETAKSLGLKIESAGGIYGGSTGTVKIGITVKDDGTGTSVNKREFETWARYDSIDPEAFGETFIFTDGKAYEICRAFAGSPKFRYGARRCIDGKMFKFTAETLRKRFPAKKKEAAA